MPKPPSLYGRHREKKLAKQVGGKTQLNSGALSQAHNKGDVKSASVLYDSKTTDKGSYKLTLKDLLKIKLEALGQDRIPAMAIQFERNTAYEFVVLRQQDFLEMLRVYEKDTSG